MNNIEKIAVLIPMYNTEKYIRRCLKSVLKQTYQNIEIIIVDDGSTDKSAEIVKQFAHEDARIKLYFKKNEKNVSITRNYLLDKVIAPYFVFVDSDDFIEPTYVEDLYHNLIKNKADCAICDFSIQIFKTPILKKKKPRVIERDSQETINEMVLGRYIHFMLWNKIYKTSLITDLRFNESCKYGEDFNFCLSYISKCSKTIHFQKKLYHYMLRLGSEMRQKFNANKMGFINYLTTSVQQNYVSMQTQDVMKAWLAFSSAGFLYLAKHSHYQNNKDLQLLKNNANKYGDSLLKHSSTRPAYRFSFKFLTKILRIKK